jgi:TPR repeat protein
LNILAFCFEYGEACVKDMERAIELYRAAAELGDARAMHAYGELGFVELDWERYHWWGRALARGFRAGKFAFSVVSILQTFEKGEKVESCTMWVRWLNRVSMRQSALCTRNACWSMTGRRLGVVKDIRVMISKMAWEEAWRWGEKDNAERERAQKMRKTTESRP